MSSIPDPSDITTCPTCHTPFDGPYCHACGERRLEQKDHSLKALLSEFFGETLFYDNKLFRSLWKCFVKPGEYLQHYLSGRRKAYLRPIQVFIIANALFFIIPAYNTFTTPLSIQTSSFLYSKAAEHQAAELQASKGMTGEEFREQYDQHTSSISKSLIFLFVIMIGVSVWAVNRGSGAQSDIISSFNLSMLYCSFLLLIMLMAVPIILFFLKPYIPILESLVQDRVFSSILLFITGTYLFAALYRINSEHPMLTLVKSAGITLTFVPVLIFYRFLLFQATLLYLKYLG